MPPLSIQSASKGAASSGAPLVPPRREGRLHTWFNRIFIFVFAIGLYYQLCAYSGRNPSAPLTSSSSFNLHQTLLSVPSPDRAREWSAYYTNSSHLAGQGWEQAQWTESKWKEFGIPDVQIASYDADLPVPRAENQRVALLQGDKVLYEAPLVDNTNGSFTPAYFGFSPDANITAGFVYCNFGSQGDFDEIARANISVVGKIGIMKLGNASPTLKASGLDIFRGIQISNAEKAGLIGVILYTDPQNDGTITEANGYRQFPAGIARPLTAIERGGFGNSEDYHMGLLPKIPCIPVSAADAVELLKVLNGIGPSARKIGGRWLGGALYVYDVGYHIGPSPAGVTINLINNAPVVASQSHNVIGTIPGQIRDEVVIVGTHRDSWGPGAGDPGSGCAAINEVVRSYGAAYRQGWRPLRTVVFASFEGEEFAQIGSLLWIEHHLAWLRATAVAYLNVVVAASGSQFHAKASPLLHRAVWNATAQVESPTVPGRSVLDVWGGSIDPAGGGDAVRFQGLPCVSTVDIGFAPGLGDAVFPYHTGFDGFAWMDRFGDPGWKHHVASAKLMSLMAAHLVESPVVHMSAHDYAKAIQMWLHRMCELGKCSPEVDLSELMATAARFARAAVRFEGYADTLRSDSGSRPGLAGRFTNVVDLGAEAIRRVNKVYIALEREFYHEGGMDGYNSLHHVLFGPAAWHNVAAPMPGLDKSLRAGNWENAKKWRDVLIEKIGNAAGLLEDHLETVGDD
ncbi:glutamate carboxypeptidase [Cordyceps militaris CM01]|uniref:Glutamate carboxypeptidase n=1 Tax=Cordyceps militaris (strain CM01) TaxID=983644 RepID=G3JP59_CORMM|nr:glutamate carboxypeptidase [Cordyceps militaris CM01]EGX89669.1 glutamate carboxypeptidase [Cordyceps militaris CM01]